MKDQTVEFTLEEEQPKEGHRVKVFGSKEKLLKTVMWAFEQPDAVKRVCRALLDEDLLTQKNFQRAVKVGKVPTKQDTNHALAVYLRACRSLAENSKDYVYRP